MPESYHYTCFLSYRHADNRPAGPDRAEGRQWASWLHNLLETYVVPQELSGTISHYGDTVPSKLYPVFQDEKELPADADLAAPIRSALDKSRTLLVICSPDAAKSHFVNEEILHFKQTGKSSRILAVIVAGEPNADDPAKARHRITPEDECFPESLRHPLATDGTLDRSTRIEPLAADLRLDALQEGFTDSSAYRKHLIATRMYSGSEVKRRVAEYSAKVELARQKILAGVLGVSVSDLVRRDAARELFRTRRRLRLTIAVCACMAILLGWAGFEHTRAENLIRQMRIVEEERRLIDLKSEQLRIQLAINELSETKREELERELAILRSEKKANEVRGNQVYDLKNAPKIGETTKFDTTTAGYIGSGS